MSADEEQPTVYVVRPSERAADQIEAEHQRLEQQSGTEAADDWEDALMEAIGSLATYPERCVIAREDELFQRVKPGQTLRQLVHKRTRGSAAWRILFNIDTPNASDPPTVRIQRVLHGAQAPMTWWPPEDQ